MDAKVITHQFMLCPNCGKTEHRIDHLAVGSSFGPWYCDSCGCKWSGVIGHLPVFDRKRIDAETLYNPMTATVTTLERDQIKNTVVTLHYVHDPRLVLKVNYFRFTERTISDTGDPSQGDEYLFNEHTCPTNYMSDVVKVILDGDEDPHGVFEYVSTEEVKTEEV